MPTDTETLAREIFVKWAAQAGPTNWQWDDMAKAALNAAERFAAIATANG